MRAREVFALAQPNCNVENDAQRHRSEIGSGGRESENAPGTWPDAQLTSSVTRDMLAALRPGELASGTGSFRGVS
jgi:hypothetical protein